MNDNSHVHQEQSLRNQIKKLQEQIANYSVYCNNLKSSFKRTNNELKIEISQKDFELSNLKQQLQIQNEELMKQSQEISNLKKSLTALCGEDAIIMEK